MERIGRYCRSYQYRIRNIIRHNERQTDSTSSESDSEESSSSASEAMVIDDHDESDSDVNSREPSIASDNSHESHNADIGIDNQDHVSEPETDSSVGSQDSESSDEEPNTNNEGEFVDGPLYNGATITIAESMMAILCFFLRFKLAYAALEGLFRLIVIHLPTPNYCIQSIYRMKQILLRNCSSPTPHYYCKTCQKSLETIDSKCDCGLSDGTTFFLTTSIKVQLQEMFKRPGFCDLLDYKYTRQKINPNNYEDIQDGSVYKSLSQPGKILSFPENLSFFWNTDDVSIYHSSSYNITPFYLTINELPPELRFKKENVILAGLWFGKSKPNPNLFMKGFSGELQDLLFNGVTLETSVPDVTRHVRCVVIGGTADLPAKAAFMNVQQFNGEFGCQVCEARCVHIGHVPTYPYQPEAALRTTEGTLALATLAQNVGSHQIGVKGHTELKNIVTNYVEYTVVDDMHCAFIGQTRHMIKLFINKKHENARWSLHNHLDILEKRFRQITPPNFVHRLPRPLSELKDWKGSELKKFLLFYSLPLFYNILPFDYYENLKLFVVGMYLVSTRSVSDEDINNSERMLNQFVQEFEVLYGADKVLPNTHMLLHIPAGARKYGPVQLYSMFWYEDLNGQLKVFVHGTRYAENQILAGLQLFVHMAGFKEKYLTRRSIAVEFIERMEKPNMRRKLLFVTNDFKIVGLLRRFVDPSAELRRLLRNEGLHYRKIDHFNRILQKGVYYESVEYTRTERTNSTCVQFQVGEAKVIGIIEKFVKLELCECGEMCQRTEDCRDRYYAIVRRMELAPVILKKFQEMEFASGFRCWFNGEQLVIDVQETDFVSCYLIYLGQSEQSFVFVTPTTVKDK